MIFFPFFFYQENAVSHTWFSITLSKNTINCCNLAVILPGIVYPCLSCVPRSTSIRSCHPPCWWLWSQCSLTHWVSQCTRTLIWSREADSNPSRVLDCQETCSVTDTRINLRLKMYFSLKYIPVNTSLLEGWGQRYWQFPQWVYPLLPRRKTCWRRRGP